MKEFDARKNHADGTGASPNARHRRRLLGILAAGGTGSLLLHLPDAWKHPVVESVVLPAHGQTTTETEAPPEAPPDLSDGSFLLSEEFVMRSPDRSILDYFHRTAHAGARPSLGYVGACVPLLDGRLHPTDVDFGVSGYDCLAEYDTPDGIPLNGSADATSIIGSLTEHDAMCEEEGSPATLEFLAVSGTAPDRTITIRLTTADDSRTIVCPEGCER